MAYVIRIFWWFQFSKFEVPYQSHKANITIASKNYKGFSHFFLHNSYTVFYQKAHFIEERSDFQRVISCPQSPSQWPESLEAHSGLLAPNMFFPICHISVSYLYPSTFQKHSVSHIQILWKQHTRNTISVSAFCPSAITEPSGPSQFNYLFINYTSRHFEGMGNHRYLQNAS